MDPTACLRLLNQAMQNDDFEEAQEHAEDLYQWLRKGGFAPADWSREEAFNLANAIINAENMTEARKMWNTIISNRPTEE